MKINAFYTDVLGAAVRNIRWSWGSYDPVVNRVYLRVWKDEVLTIEGKEYVLLLRYQPRRDSNGYDERREHLDLIRQGVSGFGVLCTAVDPATDGPREIKSFDNQYLLELGEIISLEKGFYGEVVDRVSVADLMRTSTSVTSLSNDLKAILRARISPTEREALLNARVGQGAFRAQVFRLWGRRCALSGAQTLDVIRASHIKPWRFSSNVERLDPYNGLPLAATLDALFEAGLISFGPEGHVLISRHLPASDRILFGIDSARLTKSLPERTLEYLEFHKATIFQG